MDTPSTPRLPNDILSIIFSHFCLHYQDHYNETWDQRPLRTIRPSREKQQPDAKSWYSIDRNTLFAACLSSKCLRDVAQPSLYHEFVLGYGDSWKSKLYTWQGQLASFIRTLARRPDLSYKVKIIYIHTHLFRDSNEKHRAALLEAARALGIDLPAVWKRRTSSISASDAQDWPEVYLIFLSSYLDQNLRLTEEQERVLREAMTMRSEPGRRWLNPELITMLIAQTRHLEYLSLQDDGSWPTNGLPGSALQALGVSSLPLKMLDLGIGPSPIIKSASSNLQTLNLYQCSRNFRESISEMPCLKTLRITDSSMEASTLRNLLNACTGGLVAFEFEAPQPIEPVHDGRSHCGFEGNPVIPDKHFQPSDVIESLQRHRSTLKVLHLDLSGRKLRTRKIPSEMNLKVGPC
ncbi:hypothetical protein F53441_6778 [Fusarium austroafricanum]|uniref:Uncharacterized protein n=1 Tax=Fusarium austroafricanum TaxID=2364996 RepID=A0A8H4KIX4_9HYPO|nr:hypothetical protein F53441_6778 [Fusarium austroafricanum]